MEGRESERGERWREERDGGRYRRQSLREKREGETKERGGGEREKERGGERWNEEETRKDEEIEGETKEREGEKRKEVERIGEGRM